MSFNTVVVALFLAVPAFYLYHRITSSETTSASTSSMDSSKSDDEKPKTIMQPARIDLDPPKDDPFTVEQLKEFDGSNAEKPVYVAIKGTVFDVTRKRETYGQGGSYNIFAGKDASRALGMSSLKQEDALSDYSALSEGDMKTLNDWYSFFECVAMLSVILSSWSSH
ncbi:hypothetical protein PHLCEN_2v3522 [Hermanssonia centrifuga]|uniref:Cytochrome b5 heme-binding domain-containing protein n=1 Tax=Hermanssonia centrifuga TaxID=98765 RepID=A0A2R6QEX7_9APHY|nr:hypothetical protein PHLCEN_2v3522 [Hermanssonia centrifuga]